MVFQFLLSELLFGVRLMRRANTVCTNEYNFKIVIWNKISLKGVDRE